MKRPNLARAAQLSVPVLSSIGAVAASLAAPAHASIVPQSLEEIVRQADDIVTGVVTSIEYVERDNGIYTEATIGVPSNVLDGVLSSLGVPKTITYFGGMSEPFVDENGDTVRHVDDDSEIPALAEGENVLVFLAGNGVQDDPFLGGDAAVLSVSRQGFLFSENGLPVGLNGDGYLFEQSQSGPNNDGTEVVGSSGGVLEAEEVGGRAPTPDILSLDELVSIIAAIR